VTPCSLILIARFLTYILPCLQGVDEPNLERGGQYVKWNEMDSCKKGFMNILGAGGRGGERGEEKETGSELGKECLEEQ